MHWKQKNERGNRLQYNNAPTAAFFIDAMYNCDKIEYLSQ
jgi:hypothetical protein